VALDKAYSNLSISNWNFKEFFEVFISFLLLVPLFSPLGNEFAVKDEDVEECVEKEDNVMFDRYAVQEDGLRWCVEGIGHQRRLNHDQRVVHVLFI
jgi:hypothetical protein